MSSKVQRSSQAWQPRKPIKPAKTGKLGDLETHVLFPGNNLGYFTEICGNYGNLYIIMFNSIKLTITTTINIVHSCSGTAVARRHFFYPGSSSSSCY